MDRYEELLRKLKAGTISPREKLELIQAGYDQYSGESDRFGKIRAQLPLQTDTTSDREKAYGAIQKYENNPVETTQDKIALQDRLMGMKSDQQRQQENNAARSLANEFAQPNDEQLAKIQALQRLKQGR